MIERREVRIYPDLAYHRGKTRPGPVTLVVVEGQVAHWDSFSLLLALTAIQDKRNKTGIDRERIKAYNKALFGGVREKDAEAMKEAVRRFPEMTPQTEEILELPDEMFVGAARYLTEAIW